MLDKILKWLRRYGRNTALEKWRRATEEAIYRYCDVAYDAGERPMELIMNLRTKGMLFRRDHPQERWRSILCNNLLYTIDVYEGPLGAMVMRCARGIPENKIYVMHEEPLQA